MGGGGGGGGGGGWGGVGGGVGGGWILRTLYFNYIAIIIQLLLGGGQSLNP